MWQFRFLRAALFLGCGVLVSACADSPPSPESATAPALVAPTARHAYLVVERGQSLDKIAQTYRVTKHDLIAANHLMPPYHLKPGTMLEIPAAAAKPLAKAKERRKHIEADARPVRTAGAAGSPGNAKAKHSESEVIPLD